MQKLVISLMILFLLLEKKKNSLAVVSHLEVTSKVKGGIGFQN